MLLPDQRRAVAQDWRQASAALAREQSRLRAMARAGRQRVGRSGSLWSIAKCVSRTPEVGLLILAVVAAIAVWLRVREVH
jgi:hypothetical protein